MAELVTDDPDAGPDALVLEVGRVEDARTVAQRIRIAASAWREFGSAIMSEPVPASAAAMYRAGQEFWDWLAEAYAATPAGSPSGGDDHPAAVPDASWLRERYREWNHAR